MPLVKDKTSAEKSGKTLLEVEGNHPGGPEPVLYSLLVDCKLSLLYICAAPNWHSNRQLLLSCHLDLEIITRFARVSLWPADTIS